MVGRPDAFGLTLGSRRRRIRRDDAGHTQAGVCNQETEREAAMRQCLMTVTALATFGAMVATAQADTISGSE
jgi:hypothetical protein